jgi:hypothetical protein
MVNRFISYYCQFEDLKKVAIYCGISDNKAQELYRNKTVREQIDKRLDKIHDEQAKLIAKSRKVDTMFLDDKLVEAVKKGAARGDVKALELGYRRVGIFREGEFMGAPQDPNTPMNPALAPIFRAERITTSTVTERIEGTVPAPSTEKILDYQE